MANEREYNGWTNYETWLVKLWMDNEEGAQRLWRSIAGDAIQQITETKYEWESVDDARVSALADLLKEWHDGNMPEGSGVYADLLSAALNEVEWREIARSLLDDAIQE